MYVGYHDANNVSNFGGDTVTQLHLKNRCIVLFTLFYGHSIDAVTVSAAVATRSRADCSSMECHTSLSKALVSHNKTLLRTSRENMFLLIHGSDLVGLYWFCCKSITVTGIPISSWSLMP